MCHVTDMWKKVCWGNCLLEKECLNAKHSGQPCRLELVGTILLGSSQENSVTRKENIPSHKQNRVTTLHNLLGFFPPVTGSEALPAIIWMAEVEVESQPNKGSPRNDSEKNDNKPRHGWQGGHCIEFNECEGGMSCRTLFGCVQEAQRAHTYGKQLNSWLQQTLLVWQYCHTCWQMSQKGRYNTVLTIYGWADVRGKQT